MFRSSQLISAAMAMAVVFGLGLGGFYEYDASTLKGGCDLSCLGNDVGNTLVLFLRDTSNVPKDHPPLQLTIARYLAPWVLAIVALLGALRITVANLRHDYRVARARGKFGHVIVCGLGEIGLTITQNLRDRSRDKQDDVVIVELDGDSANAMTAEWLGATVIKGDSREHSVLRLAGLAGARCVIICAGEDSRNLDIALAIKARIARGDWRRKIPLLRRIQRALRTGDSIAVETPLLILVELRDEWLFTHLIDHDKESLVGVGAEIRFFNTYQNAARILIQEMTPPPALGGAEKPIMIVGFGSMGRELALHLLQTAFAPLGQPVRLAVFDRATDAAEKFAPVLSAVSAFCEVDFLTCDLQLGLPACWESVRDHLRQSGAASVVVCLPDDKASLYVAGELRAILDALDQRDTPVFVRLGRHANLGRFVGQMEQQQEQPKRLAAFGAFPTLLAADILVGETLDRLAKANHELYRASLTEAQRRGDPNAREWSQLAEQYKMSNRRAADHFRIELAQVGFTVAEHDKRKIALFNFTEEEADLLAQLEHRRWTIERLMQGWKQGEFRDDVRRINPLLVDWSRLPEPRRAQNRADITKLPAILAEVGWEIVRPANGGEASCIVDAMLVTENGAL